MISLETIVQTLENIFRIPHPNRVLRNRCPLALTRHMPWHETAVMSLKRSRLEALGTHMRQIAQKALSAPSLQAQAIASQRGLVQLAV